MARRARLGPKIVFGLFFPRGSRKVPCRQFSSSLSVVWLVWWGSLWLERALGCHGAMGQVPGPLASDSLR